MSTEIECCRRMHVAEMREHCDKYNALVSEVETWLDCLKGHDLKDTSDRWCLALELAAFIVERDISP